MSKAENRFQARKHKAKARRVLKDVWQDRALADDKKFVGIEASVHTRRCSCSLCCRTRRNPWFKGAHKLTVQELRSNESLKEDGEILLH